MTQSKNVTYLYCNTTDNIIGKLKQGRLYLSNESNLTLEFISNPYYMIQSNHHRLHSTTLPSLQQIGNTFRMEKRRESRTPQLKSTTPRKVIKKGGKTPRKCSELQKGQQASKTGHQTIRNSLQSTLKHMKKPSKETDQLTECQTQQLINTTNEQIANCNSCTGKDNKIKQLQHLSNQQAKFINQFKHINQKLIKQSKQLERKLKQVSQREKQLEVRNGQFEGRLKQLKEQYEKKIKKYKVKAKVQKEELKLMKWILGERKEFDEILGQLQRGKQGKENQGKDRSKELEHKISRLKQSIAVEMLEQVHKATKCDKQQFRVQNTSTPLPQPKPQQKSQHRVKANPPKIQAQNGTQQITTPNPHPLQPTQRQIYLQSQINYMQQRLMQLEMKNQFLMKLKVKTINEPEGDKNAGKFQVYDKVQKEMRFDDDKVSFAKEFAGEERIELREDKVDERMESGRKYEYQYSEEEEENGEVWDRNDEVIDEEVNYRSTYQTEQVGKFNSFKLSNRKQLETITNINQAYLPSNKKQPQIPSTSYPIREPLIQPFAPKQHYWNNSINPPVSSIPFNLTTKSYVQSRYLSPVKQHSSLVNRQSSIKKPEEQRPQNRPQRQSRSRYLQSIKEREMLLLGI